MHICMYVCMYVCMENNRDVSFHAQGVTAILKNCLHDTVS